MASIVLLQEEPSVLGPQLQANLSLGITTS